MSGRRDSRVHLADRQSDALLEFENFKRKYLLVNKHITKLNSTLSVRVEELNVQLSTLYSENLRLRASEVALKTQLKKERHRSHKIVLQTEQAIGALMAQLSEIRTTQSAAAEIEISLPTKRKPTLSPVQPPRETIRLARAPADIITQIRESEEDEDEDDTPTRTVTSRRPSISRLPLPKHTSYHPLPVTEQITERPREIDLETAVGRRKLGRRTSSLFTVEAERAPSPVDGPSRRSRRRISDERRSSPEDDEEREIELQIESDLVDEAAAAPVVNNNNEPSSMDDRVSIQGIRPAESVEPIIKSEFKQTSKGMKTPLEINLDPETQSASERESSDSKKDRRRLVIKDVTNSPRRIPSDLCEKTGLRMSSPASDVTLDPLSQKAMSTPMSSIASTPTTENGIENGYDMVSQNMGRERRARKTLNYAEPKLNTKMRKPSPPPEGKPRSSGVTIRHRRSMSTQITSDEDGDADVEGAKPMKTTSRRKTVHNGTTTRESQDSVSPEPNLLPSNWNEEGRRRSMAV